ncbi:arabinose ABC transporter permease [Methylobacterium sp. Leaf102]|uniref:MFS transporter n=1 Tax=unclassified Methylobacterium TaxID=2615210 RepID=UPI0006F6DFF6|nr:MULTISPECIES: MFS transporter [unclassified Methylobacterium]USU30163.1 MFS transporter [Methylobacterium sp. OTU13CASTA1]KQO61555.1 arabinose ABC transporter permease [Methylobacterium sp. Leaf87]KQP27082.1 arabinose ABC transporter permease [Methylobacterium sp. Leaf100]KQP28800.1 arabinose ABC transporter permease [Methylobacterium sp. Leaf102]KQP63951.1 arabinose ABC transporter permease [Methylobacterium sp. Leaf112]
MSADYAVPSSSEAERHAHEALSDHTVAPGEIAIGVVIGRAAEYFDFFVYGIASVLIFPKVFFPFATPLAGTLYSFALFALAFVARPIGSAIFTEIDRRHGRGVKLTIALFLLGGSTAAIAFLPNYATLGATTIWLLAAFRFGQGLALGGAWDGLASLLALNAPEGKRGWYAMMPQLGAPIGFMLASALFAFFLANLSEADFLDFGWRYPFFVAFTINVVALFARLRLVATEEFVRLIEMRELEPTPVLETVRVHGRDILVGAFVPLASFALFHLVTVFPISWINLFTQRSVGEFLMVQFAGAVVGAGAIVISGIVADQIGRRTLVAIAAGLILLFALGSIVAPLLVGDSEVGQTIYVLVGFGLLGLSYGQTSGSVTSNLGTRYRYTGAALTSDLAWLIGAGFAPLVALSLSSEFGLAWVGVYLLSGAVATLAALGYNRRTTATA